MNNIDKGTPLGSVTRVWTKPEFGKLDFRLRDVRFECEGTPDDGLNVGLRPATGTPPSCS